MSVTTGGSTRISGSILGDARTMARVFGDGGDYGQKIANDRKYLALLDLLSFINCLPPMADNIVDPPPYSMFKENRIVNKPAFGRYCGRDYMERVIMRGEYLVLVPLNLKPSAFGAIQDNIEGIGGVLNKLTDLYNRLDVTSYGWQAEVASVEYWRAVRAYAMTGALALGIVSDKLKSQLSAVGDGAVEDYVPSNILNVLYSKGQGGGLLQSAINYQEIDGKRVSVPSAGDQLLSETFFGRQPTGTEKATGYISKYVSKTSAFFLSGGTNIGMSLLSAGKQTYDQMIQKNFASFTTNETDVVGHSNQTTDSIKATSTAASNSSNTNTTTDGSDEASPNSALTGGSDAVMNLLKYIANVDSADKYNKQLPWTVFYCNGPVERGWGTNTSIGESAVVRSTVDIGNKLTKTALSGLTNAGDINIEDYATELAYHRNDTLGNVSGLLVANTYVPDVIKQSTFDSTYTINLRECCVASDRFSLFRPIYTLAQLLPFVITQNAEGTENIIPSAPLYCSAFVKGKMNVPRGVIVSMNVRSDPALQTTEGIPTDLDITLTIASLYKVATSPRFDRIYNKSYSESKLIGAMFNPMSGFNIIATMCGQNTVLTRFPLGLFEYLIKGNLDTFIGNVQSTGYNFGNLVRDWTATEVNYYRGVLTGFSGT